MTLEEILGLAPVVPVLITYIVFQRQLQGSVQTGMLK